MHLALSLQPLRTCYGRTRLSTLTSESTRPQIAQHVQRIRRQIVNECYICLGFATLTIHLAANIRAAGSSRKVLMYTKFGLMAFQRTRQTRERPAATATTNLPDIITSETPTRISFNVVNVARGTGT